MEFAPDDKKLVERLQKGDIEAFDLLYNKYSGKLFAFGLKYLKSREESEELVQSIFLNLWENHKTLEKESSFKSYLFTIAYNNICNLYRKRCYRQKFVDDAAADNPQSSFEIVDSIDYRSLLEQVQSLINRLPERQKTIFKKSREEGKSSKEIAEELGLSPGTIDNYISDSLKLIRNGLKNEEFAFILFITLYFI